MHRAHPIATAAFTVLLAHCSGPLDSPSAYGDEVYLCEADEAREARSEECLTLEECVGWVSFRGRLQAQPVTVDSELSNADLDFVQVPEQGLVRDAIKLNANSPYFTLRWVFSELPKLRVTESDLESPIGVLDEEGSVNASLRMQGGGASVELQGREGTLRTGWTLDEQWGDAHLDFGSGDTLDGCFFARTSVESE